MKRVKSALAIGVIGLTFCGGGQTKVPHPDGGATDAAQDAPAAETGGDAAACASGLACEICNNGYTPTPMKAPLSHTNACSSVDISAYVTACGSNATATSCDTWANAEGTSAPNCLACVFSNTTDAQWGANFCDASNNCSLNIGGCIDVVMGSVAQEKQAGGAGSCGDLTNADVGCQNYACGNCQSNTDFATCLDSANANECKTYDGPATAANGPCGFLDDASAAAVACFASTDADLQTMTATFCGP